MGEPGHKTPAMAARLYELDLLRLAAALMVVAAHYLSKPHARNRSSLHYGDIFSYGDLLDALGMLGTFGVEVFFVISGFVIAMSAEGRTARAFMVSRAIRLLPAFWFCCLLSWCLIKLDPGYRQVSVPQLLASLFLVAAPLGYDFVDGVYWTLVVEIRFYLMVALLLWLRLFDRYQWFLVAWLVLAAADYLGFAHPALRLLFLPQFAPFFIAGGALYLVWSRRRGVTTHLLLFSALVLMCLKANERLVGFRPDLGPAAMGVMIVATGLLWATATGKTTRLGRPWMAAWGALTYPLYLLHEDLGFLFLRHFAWIGNGLVITALAVMTFLLLAHTVAVFVERPVAARMRRLLMPRPPIPARGRASAMAGNSQVAASPPRRH